MNFDLMEVDLMANVLTGISQASAGTLLSSHLELFLYVLKHLLFEQCQR